jgi:hypothetical protein
LRRFERRAFVRTHQDAFTAVEGGTSADRHKRMVVSRGFMLAM